MEIFNFDEWAALAKASPDEFEVRRSHYIEQIISRNNNATRLRHLQWRIDTERKRARTTFKSYLQLSTMMWDSFILFCDAMENPRSEPSRQAQIIDLRRKS